MAFLSDWAESQNMTSGSLVLKSMSLVDSECTFKVPLVRASYEPLV